MLFKLGSVIIRLGKNSERERAREREGGEKGEQERGREREKGRTKRERETE